MQTKHKWRVLPVVFIRASPVTETMSGTKHTLSKYQLNSQWTGSLLLLSNKQKLKHSMCWSQGLQWQKVKTTDENDKFELPSESHEEHSVSRAWRPGLASPTPVNTVCSLPRTCPGRFQGRNGQIAFLQLVILRTGGAYSFWHLTHVTELLMMNENASCLMQNMSSAPSHMQDMGKQREIKCNSSES